jgi:hypothetical protein
MAESDSSLARTPMSEESSRARSKKLKGAAISHICQNGWRGPSQGSSHPSLYELLRQIVRAPIFAPSELAQHAD